MKVLTLSLLKESEDETKGFKIDDGLLITFEERKLFLKNWMSNEEAEKITEPIAGTSRSFDAEKSCHSAFLGKKRKRCNQVEDEESDFETEIRRKRIKNGMEEEKEKTSVEESLFTNDLLLRTIFPCLNLNDLKSCRLVNRLWCLEATTILLKHDSLATIEISDTLVGFQNAAVYKNPIRLTDFQSIIAKSKLFPCPNFGVSNHDLSSNIINFFCANGPLVKSFCFDVENILYVSAKTPTPRLSTVYDILLLAANHLPNLRILELNGKLDTPQSAVMEMAIDVAPEMKNLQTLKFDGYFQYLQGHVISLLLKKACNLESIYFANEHYEIRDLYKFKTGIPLLKKIPLMFQPGTLETLEQVLEQNLKISSIEIIEVDPYNVPQIDLPKVGRCLSALLQKCSESLTEILDMHCLGHVPELNFPVLPNVKRLEIRYTNMNVSATAYLTWAPLLPSGVNLAQVFPGLSTVKLDLYADITPERREKVLPDSWCPLLSVRHLEVRGTIPDAWVGRICILFPNVTSAKFCTLTLVSAYESIWKLSKLKELHLAISSGPKEGYHALDSAFTGLSLETVKSLWEKDEGEFNLSAEDISGLRVKPSIVDLKELKKLSLDLLTSILDDGYDSEDEGCVNINSSEYDDYDYFDPSCKKNVEVIFDPGVGKTLLQEDDTIILSYISKLFGFDLCPQLKSNVSVAFRHFTRYPHLRANSFYHGDSEILNVFPYICV